MLRSIFRLPRYYFLQIRRLKGDPVYLAKGFAFGVFMGVLPLVPIQTLLIIPLSITLRVSTIAAVIAGTMVSNPLTFWPQYLITWTLGNAVLPGRISWENLQQVLETIKKEGLLDGIATFSHLGIKTITVLLTGGVLIGIPAGIISYFFALKFFRTLRAHRLRKQKLNNKIPSRKRKGITPKLKKTKAMVYQRSKVLLKEQGLAASKKLGQNFLVHQHTAERIVDFAELRKEDTVLEVGVGLGALTRPLAEAADQVLGLEADSGIIRLHEEQQDLPANVRLMHQDILKADFKELVHLSGGKRLKIIANLPYSISSPFLFKLIEYHDLIDFAVVMLQKEVALRLLARPGSKEYGVPTVILATVATVKMLMRIGPEEFHPQPKVDSAVIRLSFDPLPERAAALGAFDRNLLKTIVNSSFGQRRKTLLNGLSAAGLLSKDVLKECIAEAELLPTVRAEKLSLEEFVRLAQVIKTQLV